ncbi:MAG: phytanoyl-CoA dioxygenase family protein [Bacteroidia bacterium]
MEVLFRDQKFQENLDRDGCVVVPFLTPDELKELRAFYDHYHPDGVAPQMRDGIHMTIWCSDRQYKDEIREGIRRIIQPAADRLYQNFRLVTPVFIVKRQGADTTFPIHQDWNVVDETQHRAFNMWIPLHDVDEKNGALWIVKGSHKFPNHVRGPGYLFPKLYHLDAHLRPLMEPMAMPAGNALIFYHRVLHGSPPNQNEQPRVVIATSVLPKTVPLHIFFQKDAESNLEVYHPHDEFIYEFENVRDQTAFHPPSGKPVAIQAPFKQPDFSQEWFDRYYAGKPKLGFWERIFGKN